MCFPKFLEGKIYQKRKRGYSKGIASFLLLFICFYFDAAYRLATSSQFTTFQKAAI